MAFVPHDTYLENCVADVTDEFAELDEVFWSVVQNLPPDSPFLRHLAHLFQNKQDDDRPEHSGDDSESNDDSPTPPDSPKGAGGGEEEQETEANAEYIRTIKNVEDAFDIDLTSSSRFDKRPDGLYINHTCPDSDDYYLEAKTPPQASKPPEEGEVTLRSLPVEIFITLMTTFLAVGKGVNWLELGVNTRGKVKYPPRARMDLEAAHVAKVVRGKAELTKETTTALGLLTSDAIEEQWKKSKIKLDEYENVTRKKGKVVKYDGARPLHFDPIAAQTPSHFPANIFYRMQTYCMGCRHLTYLMDAHYWCMRCTLLYGFWPCTGEKGSAMCALCAKYGDAVRSRAAAEWAKLYSATEGFIFDKVAALRERLPPFIVTQYDASVAMILRKPREITLQITDSLLDRFKECYHITDGKEKSADKKKTDKSQPSKGDGDAGNTADSKRPLRSSTSMQRAQREAAKRDDAATSSAPKSGSKRKKSKKKTSSRSATPKPSTSAEQKSITPKRKHEEIDDDDDDVVPDDYMLLGLPWSYFALVICGRAGVIQITIGKCGHGLRPVDDPTPDMVDVMLEVWSGKRPIKFGFSHHGTWAVAFCNETDKCRLPVPDLPAPADDYLPPPTAFPVDFVEATPEGFLEIADPRNAEWEEFVARRLAAMYRPAFPHLHRADRWGDLLPPRFTDSDVSLVYRHDPNAVCLTDTQLTFTSLAQMSKDDLLMIVKGKLRCTERPVLELHSHLWWRECAQGMQEPLPTSLGNQYRLQIPILMRCDDPDDEGRVQTHRRPELTNAPRLPRPHQPFGGITPLPRLYLHARAQEQREFVTSTDKAELLAHTYRSRAMRLHTAPYMSAQDANLPLSSLRIPELVEWEGLLHAPLNLNVAYPVNDVTLRYLEEMQRLLIYQVSHREQSLVNLDYDLQQLLSIIGAVSPNFLPQAEAITSDALARQWAFIRDDTAVATEMLATTIHQRRQGMLCLGTDRLTLAQRVSVLSRPFQGETRIIQLDERPLTHVNKAFVTATGKSSRSVTPKPQGDDDNAKSPPVTGAANV